VTGKELIIATKPFTKENLFLSWWHTLSTFSLLILCNFLVFYLEPFYLKIPMAILTALFNSRMFVIYHDHQHKAILVKSKMAEVIFTVFGWYLLATPSVWKRSHDYHHKNNSKLFSANIGSYPIVSKKKYMTLTLKEKRMYLATRNPYIIGLGYLSMFIFGMCINPFISNPRKHWDSLLALLLHIALSVLIVYHFGWMQWVYSVIIPFTLTCGFGAYLFYAQHNFPGVWFAENVDWKYDIAALKSSSFMVMNPVMNYFTANIGYHHIHHLNARIPFYRLPEVMAHFPELQGAKRTSLSLKDIRECLRLKVWDPDLNRMVGFEHLR
jgi:omega-6 fatty acid desaturase (delta-12 desaturase)